MSNVVNFVLIEINNTFKCLERFDALGEGVLRKRTIAYDGGQKPMKLSVRTFEWPQGGRCSKSMNTKCTYFLKAIAVIT